MVEKIISSWKKNAFESIYWLEGDEPYFIDQITNYAENSILTEAEKEFNLTIFYGKDCEWISVINTCKSYPMFGDKQIVLIKEAQFFKEIEKLESYFEQPLKSTILIIAYKNAKVDGRKKFAKTLKERTHFLSFKKLYENKLPEWLSNLIAQKGYSIKSKALMLLLEFVGNDLSRLENETEKIIINLTDRKEIKEEDIENFIGISKDYNLFELQNALASKNIPKAIQIVQYFESNPKSAPMQLLIPTLYSFFSKVFIINGQPNRDEKSVANLIGVLPFVVKEYITASKIYSQFEIEKAILLLQKYNLKSIGIGNSSSDSNLLKELILKIILN